MEKPELLFPIMTEDNVLVHPGDEVFNYYDCKWGVIQLPGSWYQEDPSRWDGWFRVIHTDNTETLLDGSRISTFCPKNLKERCPKLLDSAAMSAPNPSC